MVLGRINPAKLDPSGLDIKTLQAVEYTCIYQIRQCQSGPKATNIYENRHGTPQLTILRHNQPVQRYRHYSYCWRAL
jgi:hypothetical protein